MGSFLREERMALSSDLQSRSEGSFGQAAVSPLRDFRREGGHTRQMLAAEERPPGECAWMGRNATKEVAATVFAGETFPSEIRRKTMSRKKSSLSTSPEKLGRDRFE